ncbi:DUF1206 domain-containing protein [Streptomyces sp. ST2-7A]|nr:DUF1206 domain-containing protein [Streptomyces sp. ST2-7A]
MFRGLARAGLVAQGVIHGLVGVLALQIAFGSRGEQADQQGALQELVAQPFGSLLVWLVGCGMAALALWRLTEAIVGVTGPDGEKVGKRLGAAAGCVTCAVISFSALSFAGGERSGESSDERSRDMTARALELPGGPWWVGIVGVGVIAVGGWFVVRAVGTKHRKRLRPDMSRGARRLVDVLAVGGGTARGLVFATVGFFVIRAAARFDPDEAKGLDNALRSLTEAPAGPWILTAVALGLTLFGGFAIAMARWQRM